MLGSIQAGGGGGEIRGDTSRPSRPSRQPPRQPLTGGVGRGRCAEDGKMVTWRDRLGEEDDGANIGANMRMTLTVGYCQGNLTSRNLDRG